MKIEGDGIGREANMRKRRREEDRSLEDGKCNMAIGRKRDHTQ